LDRVFFCKLERPDGSPLTTWGERTGRAAVWRQDIRAHVSSCRWIVLINLLFKLVDITPVNLNRRRTPPGIIAARKFRDFGHSLPVKPFCG